MDSVRLYLANLYSKYGDEVRELASCLRRQYHTMQRAGYETTFGDVEGELTYMLIRETQPEIVFEISPGAGWSTNYILAALTANGKGILHSFEILPAIQGEPTEQVIRANQCAQWDQRRLIIHIGDARQTVPHVDGTINFLLLDSCHEDWFAKWYIETVFPRVDGIVIIHDIAFADGIEHTSEAKYVWKWAMHMHIPLTLIGSIETTLERAGVRADYPERRGLRSNSAILQLPLSQREGMPTLVESPESWIKQARGALARGDYLTADRLLARAITSLLRQPTRVNRHRLFFLAGEIYADLGEIGESQRCFQRALGIVIQADAQHRAKGLAELLEMFVVHHQWYLAIQTAIPVLLEPRAWLRLVQKVCSQLRTIFKKVLNGKVGRSSVLDERTVL